MHYLISNNSVNLVHALQVRLLTPQSRSHKTVAASQNEQINQPEYTLLTNSCSSENSLHNPISLTKHVTSFYFVSLIRLWAMAETE